MKTFWKRYKAVTMQREQGFFLGWSSCLVLWIVSTFFDLDQHGAFSWRWFALFGISITIYILMGKFAGMVHNIQINRAHMDGFDEALDRVIRSFTNRYSGRHF